jgi:outer membrane protein TolC
VRNFLPVTIIYSTLSLTSFAVSETEVEAFVKSLPNKTVTLDLVLALGVQRSQSFKALTAEILTSQNPYLEAEAVLNPTLNLSTGFVYSEGDSSASPTAPIENRRQKSQLSLSKYFSTGTGVSLTAIHEKAEMDFAVGAPISMLGLTNYHDFNWSLGIKQNLLRDSFGTATRARLEGTQKLSTGLKFQAQQKLEDWAVGLAGLYYQAWLARIQMQVAADRRARQKRLLSVSDLQFKRGTLEEPDYLQIRSLNEESEIQLGQAKRNLENVWTLLVNNLGLPEAFLKLDPAKIPMTLDDLEWELGGICTNLSREENFKRPIPELEAARARSEAGDLLASAARSQLFPVVSLDFSVGSKGLDESSSNSLSEAASIDYPSYYAGLSFEWKFGDSGARARALEAHKLKLQGEAALGTAQDTADADLRDLCRKFAFYRRDLDVLARVLQDRKRRSELDERRFRIGRIDVTQVIRSGDEFSGTQLAFEQQNIAVHETLWKLRRYNLKMNEYVEKLKLLELKGL